MSEKPTKRQNGGPRYQTARALAGNQQKRKEKTIMAIMIVAAVVMVMAAIVVTFWNRWIVEPDIPNTIDADKSPAPVQSGNPAPEAKLDFEAVAPLVGGERKSADFRTILVFGADKTSGLTDTIMVVSYDIANQKATVMSIPRDTVLNVSYHGTDNKLINAQYKLNGEDESGIEALKEEVSKLIGFVPDYYVMINWELVGQMVEAIGGVWFDVPFHMGYDDGLQDLYIHLEKGYQLLDGKQAMNLVRWRDNNDGTASPGGGSDLSRLNIQHDFLKAVLRQTLQIKNTFRIGQLAELFQKNVVSDLTVENLYWFGSQAIMGGLNVDDVSFVTMPNYGVDIKGAKFRYKVCPVKDQLLTLINGSLNPFVQDVTLRQLDLIQINPDGNTLSSTTGHLADPSAGIPPVIATSKPTENEGSAGSAMPVESDTPVESDVPIESDAPIESVPAESIAPVEGSPEAELEFEPVQK